MTDNSNSLPPYTADPRDCPECDGTMTDVGENSVVAFECEDCLARFRPGPKPVDEEVA